MSGSLGTMSDVLFHVPRPTENRKPSAQQRKPTQCHYREVKTCDILLEISQFSTTVSCFFATRIFALKPFYLQTSQAPCISKLVNADLTMPYVPKAIIMYINVIPRLSWNHGNNALRLAGHKLGSASRRGG